jgi:hypothetical protein
MDNVFTAGDLVPYSGIYCITHYPPHTDEEAVTLTEGNRFPLCVRCSHVSFMLVSELTSSELLHYAHEL